MLGDLMGLFDMIGAPVKQHVEGLSRSAQGLFQPIQADAPDIRYMKIPPGERGTVATLKVMKSLVLGRWGSRNPQVVMLARRITHQIPSKDYRAEADAIFRWVKRNVPYRLDPAGLEWVQTPHYTLFGNRGAPMPDDCESHATAIAALALASGHQAAFRTIKSDKTRPSQWSHVYAMIGVRGAGGKVEWLSADSTQKESVLGWNPPAEKIFEAKTWVIEPEQADMDWE